MSLEHEPNASPEGAADAALWQRAQQGDAGAFGELFGRHAGAVYGHCFRRCGDWAMAEDLTSVVFLEAWRCRDRITLEPGQTALPWLLGIAGNVLASQRRSLRRHRELLEQMPDPEPVHDHAQEVVERLASRERAKRAQAALAQLNRKDQDVISICLIAGLSYEDAAIALGVPIGTVRSRLSRARQRLADVLAEQEMAWARMVPFTPLSATGGSR